MNCPIRTLLCLSVFCTPVIAQVTGITTLTTSISRSIGPINANYQWPVVTLGPASIQIDDFGTCTLAPGPYPNCILQSGIGTPGNPFNFQCSTAIALSNCTQPGVPFTVAGGDSNIDVHTNFQTVAAAAAAIPVPLSPWVIAGNMMLVTLLAAAGLNRRSWRRSA